MAGRSGRTPPQPATPARKGKVTARQTAKTGVLGRVFARPGMIVAGASFAAVMTGIVANALILQRGHHPSPLFTPAVKEVAQSVPLPPPAPRQALTQPPATPDVPAPAPTPAVEVPAPAAQPVVTPPAHAAIRPHGRAAAGQNTPSRKEAPAHKTVVAAHRDPIAQLLGRTQ